MELNEVKIGDLVSFRHKKKQVKGKVIYRHDGNKRPALMGHVNVEIIGDKQYPVTVHVAKLRPASLKEEYAMENTVTVQDLLSHINSGNNVEAEQVLDVILQNKINDLMNTAKVEVAQEMFNTQECAECEAEEVEEEKHEDEAEDKKLFKKLIKKEKKMDEALIGGQKKIDTNHNGKLDAQDFKMLRAKKKGMKEDVEQVDEANLTPYRNSELGARSTKRAGQPRTSNSKQFFRPPEGFTKKGIEKGKGVKTT